MDKNGHWVKLKGDLVNTLTVSFQPDGVIIQDERESRKEQLLQVAQRVQSEYSFRYVALGGTSHEDLSGLASTDEYVIVIIIIIRVFIKNSSSRRKV